MYNNREKEYLFGGTLIGLLGGEAMSYQELIREKVSEFTLYRRRRQQESKPIAQES